MKTFLPTTSQLFYKIIRVLFMCLPFAIPPQIVFSQTRTFVNPGLEFNVAENDVQQLDSNFGFGSTLDMGLTSTQPWYTTHSSHPNQCNGTVNGNCHPIEVWGSGFGGVTAAQGKNFVELNAFVSSMIYQNIYLKDGDTLTYYYRHRARSRTSEQTSMVIEDQNQRNIATIHQTRVPSSTRSWSVNEGIYHFTGNPGIYRVGFRALVDGGTGGLGNFLDDIKVTLNPIIDLKGSNALSSCEGQSNGTLFLRINGAITQNTKVAVELINPKNGNSPATDADISLTPVRNSNGTPTITHTKGSNIYLITIPPGNYDGGITPGYSSLTNNEDGITININAVSDGLDEPLENYSFEIKPQNTNGASNNFDSTSTPVFRDTYYPKTNNYVIEKCECYDDANTSNIGEDSKVGITLLGRASENNKDNWPMIRKGAHLVLESNSKGFVITRLTTSQINNLFSPQEGMIVYDTTAKCLKLYDGNSWACHNVPTCP